MSKNVEAKKAQEIILATETKADEILANKHAKIELDKRRQESREALRNIEKQLNEKSVWITIGSMLVKVKREKAMELLKKDVDIVNHEINVLESRQRVLVNEHRDLEYFSPYSGTHLKPLSHKEFSAFKANFPLL